MYDCYHLLAAVLGVSRLYFSYSSGYFDYFSFPKKDLNLLIKIVPTATASVVRSSTFFSLKKDSILLLISFGARLTVLYRLHNMSVTRISTRIHKIMKIMAIMYTSDCKSTINLTT